MLLLLLKATPGRNACSLTPQQHGRGGGGEGGKVGNGLDSRRVGVVDDDRATRTQTDNCHGYGKIVLGVAVERGPAITITKWAMALERQHGD